MRPTYTVTALVLLACSLVLWLLFPVGLDWWAVRSFSVQETGTLSNGWEYALYKHSESPQDRFLLRVVEPSGRIRRLKAHRVAVAPQPNGTTSIQFRVKGLSWESSIDQWWDLFYQPGLWPHSQGMQRH